MILNGIMANFNVRYELHDNSRKIIFIHQKPHTYHHQTGLYII